MIEAPLSNPEPAVRIDVPVTPPEGECWQSRSSLDEVLELREDFVVFVAVARAL